MDGNDTGSFWIPLDNVSKSNSLKVLKGSHKFPKLIKPTKWSNNQSWYDKNDEFINLPFIDEKKVFNKEMNKGDGLFFQSFTFNIETTIINLEELFQQDLLVMM